MSFVGFRVYIQNFQKIGQHAAELWPNDVLQYGASSVGHLEFKNFNFSNWILVITIVYLT